MPEKLHAADSHAGAFLKSEAKCQTDSCKAARVTAINSTNAAQDHKAAIKGV